LTVIVFDIAGAGLAKKEAVGSTQVQAMPESIPWQLTHWVLVGYGHDAQALRATVDRAAISSKVALPGHLPCGSFFKRKPESLPPADSREQLMDRLD